MDDFTFAHPQVTILVVGDSRFLLELIVLNLAPLATATILLDSGQPPNRTQGVGAAFDNDDQSLPLVVLALSNSASEPVVILAQAGLTHIIGVIPLLIISDRPFHAGPEHQIYHLLYPFRANTFRREIDEMLQGAALRARLNQSEECTR